MPLRLAYANARGVQSFVGSVFPTPKFTPPPRPLFLFLLHAGGHHVFLLPQELGAEIVRVLFRNANLFRAIASAAAVEGEAGQKEGSLEQQAALETAGEAAVAGKPRTARTLSLPTPGGFGGVQDGLGGAGEMRQYSKPCVVV